MTPARQSGSPAARLPFWQCFNVNSWSYFYVALVARRCHVAFIGPTAALKCLLNKQISFVSANGRGRAVGCRVAVRRSR